MTQPLAHRRYFTAEEYLRIETDSSDKHEFRDGQITAMAGGSPDHSLIIANTIRSLGNKLLGKPCRVYDSNLRVRIAKSVRYSYPDISVICGETEYDPQDTSRTTVTNPRLIIEVLSPSTELFDRGEKFERYLQLESMKEYVLVAQHKPDIQTYFRQPGGEWLFTPVQGLEALAKLRSLQVELPLAEVYAGVTFPPVSDLPNGEPQQGSNGDNSH